MNTYKTTLSILSAMFFVLSLTACEGRGTKAISVADPQKKGDNQVIGGDTTIQKPPAGTGGNKPPNNQAGTQGNTQTGDTADLQITVDMGDGTTQTISWDGKHHQGNKKWKIVDSAW